MTNILSQNSQAILLLTAPLIVGRAAQSDDLLTPGEYNRLARFLRENQKQPGDLIAPLAAEVITACGSILPKVRLETLLGRGFLLSQAVERWSARSIWVIGRPDANYPRRLKLRLKEDAPPLLYGCGDHRLLDSGGLAIVGSRNVDTEVLEYALNVGRLVAAAGRAVISGGAKGVDRASMSGALQSEGLAVGVLADSLERAVLMRDNREPLMDRKLVLVSPYDPAAGFNVGHAMQRNKIIYALADAALVVNSDFEKGGTWAGALEQLEKFRFIPVFIRNGGKTGKGNQALLDRGGLRWPEPNNSAELLDTLASTGGNHHHEPTQELLILKEKAPVYASGDPTSQQPTTLFRSEQLTTAPNLFSGTSNSSEKLFATVRNLISEQLKTAKTETELTELLGITKSQARAWIKQLLNEGTLEKVKKSRPPKFRAVARLL